jgi:glutamyl-tRNA synthetase
MKQVRVRFAPSPTGPLHIGGVRTALFNYLFARHNNGKFLLRIEDTDQTRYVEGAEQYIVESLKWCGIEIDEGYSVGGDFGPYKQSERKEIYKQYADKLISEGNAYYAFDTPEDLDKIRSEYEAEKKTFTYDSSIRTKLNNSLALSENEVKELIEKGVPYVIRFKMPENEEVVMNDIIRGTVKVHTSTLDDKVLFKSDGLPTYHLANIVDDYMMQISHVIRGEEWLPSLPLHVLLYRALGWDAPEFAHLPLILKPSGKGKLSKRDGDQLGFPVFPLKWVAPNGDEASGYRESGYLPDAFANFMAMLGWNPGTEQEIFSMKELTEQFTLERVGKSGSRFDPDKIKWFNHQYIASKDNSELAELFAPILQHKGIDVDMDKLTEVSGLVKERVNLVHDFWEQASFFFEAPADYDAKVIKKRWKEGMNDNMNNIVNILSDLADFNEQNAHDLVVKHIQDKELNMGQIMNSIRLCLVGAGKGPDLFKIAEVIGKEETIARIKRGADTIKR